MLEKFKFPPKLGLSSTNRTFFPVFRAVFAAINPAGVAPYKRRDTEHVNPLMRPTKSDYDRYIWLVQQGRECKWNADWLRKNSSFKVADPAMHFILLRANRDLRLIGINLGEDISEIDSWIASLEKGASKLWNAAISSYDSFDLLNSILLEAFLAHLLCAGMQGYMIKEC